MKAFVLAAIGGGFCHAPGEPLRGITVSHEGGRERHYPVGMSSHRASTRMLVCDLACSADQYLLAARQSLQHAFPGKSDLGDSMDDALDEVREFLGIAEGLEVGAEVWVERSEVHALDGTPTTRTLAAQLAVQAQRCIDELIGPPDPDEALSPAQVLARLQQAQLTLGGRPARAVGVQEAHFILIATHEPVLGSLHVQAQWDYRAALRILKQGGHFPA